MDLTAERGTLVVLSGEKWCYKVNCNSTCKILQARDVTFIEERYEQFFVEEAAEHVDPTINHDAKLKARKVQASKKYTTSITEVTGDGTEMFDKHTIDKFDQKVNDYKSKDDRKMETPVQRPVN